MNRDQLEGSWKQIKGALRKQWGKLTDDDLEVGRGDKEMLAGRLQERYGVALEHARQQVKEFFEQYRHPTVATEGDPVDTDTLKTGM